VISIDGSTGEGGGQILRTSLALSMLTQTPFVIDGIRQGRKKPGLMRQHLTCVRAALAVCQGTESGAEIGSTRLEFTPGEVLAGNYEFQVGSAGSSVLVLQTVAPALFTSGQSTVKIGGGTHNPMAPSADFLQKAWIPALLRMGIQLEVECERPGFYPAGGGALTARFTQADFQRAEFVEGTPQMTAAWAAVVDLPQGVAHRELEVLAAKFGWAREDMRSHRWEAHCCGNVLAVEFEAGDTREVFVALGEQGRSAEAVANGLCSEIRDYLAVGAPVGPHLADQLILPMVLAGGGRFRTGPPTAHTETQIQTVQKFMDIAITCECIDKDRRLYEIVVGE
jgi:RNA 3'-terminal phosphate cyclase (ATP)